METVPFNVHAEVQPSIDRPDLVVLADGQVEAFARFEREALPGLRERRTRKSGA